MTPASIDRIQRSFCQVAPQIERVAAGFYTQLFAADPVIRALFKSDLTAQARHLAAALALIVRNLPMLDALEEPLHELGAVHAALGVRPEHYPPVRDAMLASISD